MSSVGQLFSSHYVSNPSPPPSHDDGVNVLLKGPCMKLLIVDGIRPEDAQEFFEPSNVVC